MRDVGKAGARPKLVRLVRASLTLSTATAFEVVQIAFKKRARENSVSLLDSSQHQRAHSKRGEAGAAAEVAGERGEGARRETEQPSGGGRNRTSRRRRYSREFFGDCDVV